MSNAVIGIAQNVHIKFIEFNYLSSGARAAGEKVYINFSLTSRARSLSPAPDELPSPAAVVVAINERQVLAESFARRENDSPFFAAPDIFTLGNF